MHPLKIVFVHGYGSSRLSDWYPAVSAELDRLGIDYAVPDFPSETNTHAETWLNILHDAVRESDKPLVLVGHSLGSRLALLFVEKYRIPLYRLFLISAFANRTENALRRNGMAYPDFFRHEIDLGIIKPLIGKTIIAHSKEDHSIPFAQAVRISRDLDAEFLPYDDQDHFCEPSSAPEILRIIRTELGF